MAENFSEPIKDNSSYLWWKSSESQGEEIKSSLTNESETAEDQRQKILKGTREKQQQIGIQIFFFGI